jgi:PiT family inorganic phosphate transporter
MGIVQGQVNLSGVGKIVLCWLGTPLGGMLFYVLFHALLKAILRIAKPSIFVLDPLLRLGLVLVGCYGAYALGANNVANVAGVLVGAGLLSVHWAVLVGGLSIAAGILTFSKPVMLTVGRSIVEMHAFSALAVVMAAAATVHLYAVIGVPVSTSQAVVGGLLGISLVRGWQLVKWRTLARVSAGWVATPFVGALFVLLLYFLTHLEFQP